MIYFILLLITLFYTQHQYMAAAVLLWDAFWSLLLSKYKPEAEYSSGGLVAIVILWIALAFVLVMRY